MFRTRLTVQKLINATCPWNPRCPMLSDDAALMPRQGDGDQAQPCILHVSYSTHYFKGDLHLQRAATCTSHQRRTVANPANVTNLPGLC